MRARRTSRAPARGGEEAWADGGLAARFALGGWSEVNSGCPSVASGLVFGS